MEYLIIPLKSIAIYIFIIGAIRLFGKKELSQLSVIDLVFILLISNSVQNAMVGTDTSVQGGMAAALGLFVCNFIFRFFLRKSKKFSHLVQGHPIVLVHRGRISEHGLEKSGLSRDEVEMTAREHGVNDFRNVDLMVLEIDGNVSVLTKDFSHKTVLRHKKIQTEKQI